MYYSKILIHLLCLLILLDIVVGIIAIPYLLGEGGDYWMSLKYIRIIGLFIGIAIFGLKIVILFVLNKKYSLEFPNNKAYLFEFNYLGFGSQNVQ